MAMHDFVVAFSCHAEIFFWTEIENFGHFPESMDILQFDLVPGFLEIMDKKWH